MGNILCTTNIIKCKGVSINTDTISLIWILIMKHYILFISVSPTYIKNGYPYFLIYLFSILHKNK